MSSDDLVIVGGAGFIGRRLVQMLQGRARTITVVSRNVVDGRIDKEGVRYRRGDLEDADQAKRLFEGATVVYDLSKPVGSAFGDDFHDRCVACARNLAAGVLANSVRRVIYTSTSAAVYLGARKKIDERDGYDEKPHLRNAYSSGKIAAERLLSESFLSSGLPVVIFRPFLVVGPGGELAHGGVGTWSSPNLCLGWGRGDNPLPFVLVEDVAQAMAAALDAPGIEGKTFNLAGDVYIPASQYVGMIAEVSRRNFRFYPRSLARMWMLENLQHSVKRIASRESKRPSYRDMVSQSKRSFVDCTAAKTALGWRPNGNFDRFRSEAIVSHFGPIRKDDLRLER